MQAIDQLSKLAELLASAANQNALAAKEACKSISKSNGTLRRAICGPAVSLKKEFKK